MAIKFSTSVRNAMLDSIEATIGTSAVLKIRSGSMPANCAAADSGSVLASLNLPADYMDVASGGVKSKLGTWQDTNANAAGIAGHWRIYASGGAVCHMQGTITAATFGGDMELENIALALGQTITITSFTLTAGGA